jgi:hypothetical protein
MSMLKHCVLAILLFGVSTTDGAMAKSKCRLSADDKMQNAHLSFDDFDQKGVTSTTWRQLDNRGCHAVAAKAAEDYLINGPALTAAHKEDILFHEAQSLAFVDKNAQAAQLVAAAIPKDRANHGDLDWITYLVGTWAFLVKDKSLLDSSATKMSAEPGAENAIDANVLRGLAKCFNRSYRVAYASCRPKYISESERQHRRESSVLEHGAAEQLSVDLPAHSRLRRHLDGAVPPDRRQLQRKLDPDSRHREHRREFAVSIGVACLRHIKGALLLRGARNVTVAGYRPSAQAIPCASSRAIGANRSVGREQIAVFCS